MQYRIGEAVEVKGGLAAPWLPAKVVELGPRRIFKVTYPGWSTMWDEYVSEEQCKFENGEQVIAASKVDVGAALSCLWADGSRYPAKVLHVDKAVIRVLKKGYPPGYETWVPASEIKGFKGEIGDEESRERSTVENNEGRKSYKVGDTVQVKGNKSRPWIPAKVVEVGPKRIFRVTYPGWSKVYDEYVGESQCQFENGEQVTAASKVEAGATLNCRWGDGTRYPAKVLHVEEGLIRVLKEGYPTGYETWMPASEIQELAEVEDQGAGGSFADILLKAYFPALSQVQEDSAQVKRSDEIPRKRIAVEKKSEHKDSARWKQMLSSTIIDPNTVNKVKNAISKEKKPAWSGKTLLSHEYHVSVAASEEDQSYAECLSRILKNRGLKVTTDSDDLHEARVFIVIYSDSASHDENLVRHLTRAAERFNMAETIIIPVVRHYCTAEVLDHIPDNLAYSLSNTVMFNLDLFSEPMPMAIKKAIDDVEGVIRNYSEEKQNYDLSGLWLCQATVDNELSGYSYIKEFTILINQMGSKIVGKTVDGFQVKGELQGRVFKCRLTYRGPWTQVNIPWKEDDYCFVAEIVAVVHNQGYRLEGDCAMMSDVADKTKKEGDRFLEETGLFNATLEKSGLSGYYNSHWYTNESYEESLSIVHRGGNELMVDFDGCFGILNRGFYDPSTGNILMNFCDGKLFSKSILGKLTKDADGSTAIQCFYYSVEHGITEKPHAFSLTRDALHYIKEKESDEHQALLELYQIKPERSLDIPFTPGSYTPLQKDEFAVVICCTNYEKEKAIKLKQLLEEVQEITPVSIKYSDAAKNARTIVLLLSGHIQEEPDMIEVISDAAERQIPIFNIGLDSWFNIFGEDMWKDANLRLTLMNALARLNQTPDTTLDPNHSNFRGLVKGIRLHVDPPEFWISGLWGVEVISPDPEEKVARYSDLEDSSMQVVHKPSMLFLYFNHLTNELMMGTDYLVQNLEGALEPETFTLKMKNAVGRYELRINEEMDKMYGTYWSDRAQREYYILLTRAEGALSGVYRMGAEQYLTGIVQIGKSVASIMFGGYVLPAMIDKNQLIFNAPVPLTPHTYVTYVARIALAPDGNYLAGFSFQSKVMESRHVFDAIQYTTRMQRVEKRKGGELYKVEKFVETLVERYWKSLEENNYKGFCEVLSEDSKNAVPKEAFEKQRDQHLRLEGKYIPGSLTFIGSKPQHQLGKPVNATRYDFKMSFEKMKNADFATMVEDKTKKLTTIASYEEEAKMMHASQYDVMISYRSWDARFVDLLQAFLESKGFSVWRDRRMEVGVNWSEDITRAVRKSSCVVAAISENYLASALCTKEVRMADDIGKPIIPLILPETCSKDDPRTKLVSSHYKERHLPHTIAKELSQVSWCDMRPEAALNTPDPKDVSTFEKKYQKVLTSLRRMVNEVVLHAKVLDMKGSWSLTVGSGASQHVMDMVIVANDGTNVEGVMTSSRYQGIDISIEKKKSWCLGSHILIVGTLLRNQQSNTLIIEAKVAANGNELAGTLRFHNTPWEYPEGQEMNPLAAMSYKTVENDSTLYPLKGNRNVTFEAAPASGVQTHFVLDMERAMAIVKESFKDMPTESLETNIVLWQKGFDKYDTDQNHVLDMKELELALRVANANVSAGERKSIMRELDKDDSGSVDFYEFLEFIARITKNKGAQKTAAVNVVKKGTLSKTCSLQ